MQGDIEWSWGNDNDKEVMEGLQPHTNLQSFPSRMLRPVGNSNTGLLLLDNLIRGTVKVFHL